MFFFTALSRNKEIPNSDPCFSNVWLHFNIININKCNECCSIAHTAITLSKRTMCVATDCDGGGCEEEEDNSSEAARPTFDTLDLCCYVVTSCETK